MAPAAAIRADARPRPLRARMPREEEFQCWTDQDIEAYEQAWALKAREDFYAYRQYMRPQNKWGWWNKKIAYALQNFYEDYQEGKRPVLLLISPPQHGKSTSIEDFASWVAGKDNTAKEFYCSYSENLGIRTNRVVQRTMDSPKYKRVFPETCLNSANVITLAGRPLRNAYVIEYTNSKGELTTGYFRNTTVNGQITGQGMGIGFIDDPIKGRAEAMSLNNRDKVWEWLTDDFMTRFEDTAGFVLTMTRWHMDDPGGRLLERFPHAVVVHYPAIATEDEEFRSIGDPLFPEHKSLEFLLERKNSMSQASWESLYQGSPIIVGGGMFPVEKFKLIDLPPNPRDVKQTVRYWDKAATEDGGAYTAGVLMHEMKDGTFVVSDVVRGQWSAMVREQRMRQVAELDRQAWNVVRIWIEQEPGSGGKESAERSVMNLRGFIVKLDKVTGAKEIRAEPYSSQVERGNVALVKSVGPNGWNKAFIDEHEHFPTGTYKDQVDAAAGAFAKLATQYPRYDVTLSNV